MRELWFDIKLAYEVFRGIRRMTYMRIDRDENFFELRWYSGPRKSDLDRVAEHRAAQGLETHR